MWKNNLFVKKTNMCMECCLAQRVEQASHVQRLWPQCGGSRLESRPRALCCMSLLPLFQPVSCHVFNCPVNKAKGPKKINTFKKKIQKKPKNKTRLSGNMDVFTPVHSQLSEHVTDQWWLWCITWLGMSDNCSAFTSCNSEYTWLDCKI